jgi:hypothetical protein
MISDTEVEIFYNSKQELDVKYCRINQISKTLVMEIKRILAEKKQQEMENFNEWMRSKVKSVHYSNNQLMLNAYAKIN